MFWKKLFFIKKAENKEAWKISQHEELSSPSELKIDKPLINILTAGQNLKNVPYKAFYQNCPSHPPLPNKITGPVGKLYGSYSSTQN